MIRFAQIETTAQAASNLVDHAATMSDRWMFIASLFIIIGGGALAIRWLVTSLNKKDTTLAESMKVKDALHSAERSEMLAQMKAEHLECREARKEDQAAFLKVLESKDNLIKDNTEAVKSLTSAINKVERPNITRS